MTINGTVNTTGATTLKNNPWVPTAEGLAIIFCCVHFFSGLAVKFFPQFGPLGLLVSSGEFLNKKTDSTEMNPNLGGWAARQLAVAAACFAGALFCERNALVVSMAAVATRSLMDLLDFKTTYKKWLRAWFAFVFLWSIFALILLMTEITWF